eukprot:2313063-Prymnesium_polylepis.1
MVLACHQRNAHVAGSRRSCILEHKADPKKHPKTPVGTRSKSPTPSATDGDGEAAGGSERSRRPRRSATPGSGGGS